MLTNAESILTNQRCPKCGSAAVDIHTYKRLGLPWFLCRLCGTSWDWNSPPKEGNDKMIRVRLCKVSDSCDNKGIVKNYESLDQCFKELMTPGNEYCDAASGFCDPPSFLIYKDSFEDSDFCVVAYDDCME